MSHSETRAARLLREMRVSFVLALPLVLGQASSMAMNIVDTALAGRHGPVTLAAVGVGSAVWSVVILVSIGVLMAVPPTVAQLNGAGRRGEIGAVFRQALWLALALGLGLFFVVRGGALALAPMASRPRPGRKRRPSCAPSAGVRRRWRFTSACATSARASPGPSPRWCSASPAWCCWRRWATG